MIKVEKSFSVFISEFIYCLYDMIQIGNSNSERWNLQGHGQLKKSEMTFATNTTKMILDSQFMDKHLVSLDWWSSAG